MKKGFKKIIATVLAGTMIFSVAACGKDLGTKDESTATQAKESEVGTNQNVSEQTEEKVELSLFLPDSFYGLAQEEKLQKATAEFVAERANVIIDAIPVESAGYNDKLVTMVAGGDVPDVFQVMSALTLLPNYVARGVVLELDEYLADSPLLGVIDKSYLDLARMDGKTYGIPMQKPLTKVLYVRKDIMDKYDIKFSSNTPTTEEFVNEMSKLKGTGVIPITAPNWIDNLQYYFNSFGAYAGVYKNEAGKYVDGFQEEQMIDALEYVKSLYADGLLDPEFITNTGAVAREKIYAGNAACLLDYTFNYHLFKSSAEAAGAATDYYPIYSLIGPDGKGDSLNEAIQNVLCISADTKNPEKAFELIETLMLDPEANVAMFYAGVEGAHYTVKDGVATATQEALNANYAMDNKWAFINFIENEEDVLNFELPEDFLGNLDTLLEINDAGIANAGPKYTVPAKISETYDEVGASIASEWKSVASQIIMGTVSVEDGMNSYKNFWKSIDGEKILEELNANS